MATLGRMGHQNEINKTGNGARRWPTVISNCLQCRLWSVSSSSPTSPLLPPLALQTLPQPYPLFPNSTIKFLLDRSFPVCFCFCSMFLPLPKAPFPPVQLANAYSSSSSPWKCHLLCEAFPDLLMELTALITSLPHT